MVRVTVRLFASARELLDAERLDVELPDGADVAALRDHLAARAAELARLPLAFAVNREYCTPERVLADGDEVAMIPPISGGAADAERGQSPARDAPRFGFALSRDPLAPGPLEAACRTDRDGAVVTFAGVTRDHNEGRRVRGLSYECYAEMAESVTLRILEEVGAAHDIGRARVAHRLGEVPIGAASVLVVVASAHRGPAFAACREIMDRLKLEVPIFKKEWLEDADGGTRWVGELPSPRS